VDGEGRTALHRALAAGSGDVAEAAALLLQRGARVGSRDLRGAAPLHFAGSTQAMALLLGAGAEVDARDHEGRTPLIWVLDLLQHTCSSIEEVRCLLNHGADANACDADGRTTLSYAVSSPGVQAVEALLQAGASIGGGAGGARLILEAVAAADRLESAADADAVGALMDAGAGVSIDDARAFAEHAARVEHDDFEAVGSAGLAATTARLLRAAVRAHEEAEDARVAGKLAAAVEADRRDVASGLHSLAAGAAAEMLRLEAARAAAAAAADRAAAAAAGWKAAAAERAELRRLRAEVAALRRAMRAAPAAAGTDGGRQSGDGGSSQGAAQPRAKRARGAAS
jgi:hypothetical protein